MQTERIILGIDPGTNIMGYGIILCKGKKMEMVCMDVLKLASSASHSLKLRNIFETTLDLIEKYHPDEMALEAPFFGKNVQSMLKLGRAQGVAMAAALSRNLPVVEYSPRKIKQSITGKGNASKEQVAAMLIQLLNIKEELTYLDATDGLAAAVCHFFQKRNLSADDNYNSWKSFINKNPDRIS